MRLKKIISYILITSIILSYYYPSNGLKIYAAPDFELGEYIEYGSYNGDPILWRIIDFDEYGDPLLYSENILSYKPFDSAESGEWGKVNEDRYISEYRQQYGSNRWYNSNIREWLNSNSIIVNYTTAIPTSEGVWNGTNAYDNESGFLTHFTDKEQMAIKPVINKTVLSITDKKYIEGGSSIHDFIYNDPQNSVLNYSTAYYETSEDRVFLLSVEELAKYVQGNNFNWEKTCTKEAYEADESGRAKPQGTYSNYWLRTPSANNSTSVRNVTLGGKINYDNAYYNNIGIVPAMYLNIDTISIANGQGSIDAPYVLDIINHEVTFKDKNFESAIRETINKLSGTIYNSDVNKITELYASGRQITNIEGIGVLKNLEVLDLSFNEIRDLSPLRALNHLKEVYIQYNAIEDISPAIDVISQQKKLSEVKLNVTGNSTTDESIERELELISNEGYEITYFDDTATNSQIEALISTYQSSSVDGLNASSEKEALTHAIEKLIIEAGCIDAVIEDNFLHIDNNLIEEAVKRVMVLEKQASRQLIENNICLNRAIESVITIQADSVEYNNAFVLELSQDIAQNSSIDKIIINTMEIQYGFSPNQLKQDLLRDENIKIVLEKTSATKEVSKDLDIYREDKVNKPLGSFALGMENLANKLLENKTNQASTIMSKASVLQLDEEVALYNISLINADKQVNRLEGQFEIGFSTNINNDFQCVYLQTEQGELPLGGIINKEQQKLFVKTNATGAYYVADNMKVINDIHEFKDEERYAIKVLASKEIIMQTENGKFMPEQFISRAEFATAIVRLAFMYDETAETNFDDVSKDDPYYPFISSSEENGIIDGYGNNTFKPNSSIVNSELTKISSAVLVYFKDYIYPYNSEDYINYKDEDISEWVKDYLALQTREGTVYQDNQEYYKPNAEVTRLEAAVILYKLFKKL